MFVRLKDDQGVVSLVNLMQAKYIQPAKLENGEPAIRIVWSHDTFKDHGDDDIPDESCEYSEQIYIGVTIEEIENALTGIGMPKHKPTENGKTNMEKVYEGIETIREAKSKPIPETPDEPEPQKPKKPVIKGDDKGSSVKK